MGKEFDNLLKESLQSIFISLSKTYFGFEIISQREIPLEALIPVERHADFVKIITTENNEELILHLEFQVADDLTMIYRMAEYHAILMRKYELPVHHFVIYAGPKAPKMRSSLKPNEVFKKFTLLNLKQFDYEKLLASEQPEEILLAILGNFKRSESEVVIRKILNRFKDVLPNTNRRGDFVEKLNVISRLRKLRTEVKKQAEDMPIIYDETTDDLFIKGIKKGKQQGIQEGEERKSLSFIQYLLKNSNHSCQEIAKIVDVSLEFVEKVKQELSL